MLMLNDRRRQGMSKEDRNPTSVRIAEIERLIKEFKEKFEAGTMDADNFITMSEIERMWAELQNNTNNVYSDMLKEMMSSVDESDLIRKKKESSANRE
jgi:Ca2+-binding EF-hand superfamily protein